MRWLGAQLNMEVALVRIDAAVVAEVGGIAKRIRTSFEVAHARKAILCIDEFEAVAVPRNNRSSNVGQWSRETTSALLQLLDSKALADLIVVGATNIIENVDEAVQRRMRQHVYFFPPDATARARMLREWWNGVPRDIHVEERLVELTEGYSGDVLQRAAEDANTSASERHEHAPIALYDVEAAFFGVVASMALTEAALAGVRATPLASPAVVSNQEVPVDAAPAPSPPAVLAPVAVPPPSFPR